MVRKGSIAGTNGSNFPPKDTPKNKFVFDYIFSCKNITNFRWLNAARNGISKDAKKMTNINSSNGKKLSTEVIIRTEWLRTGTTRTVHEFLTKNFKCISNKTVEQVPVKLNNETVALEHEQRRTQPELRSRVAIKNDIHSTNEEPPSKDKNLSIQQKKILLKLTEQISGLEGKQTLVNNGELFPDDNSDLS